MKKTALLLLFSLLLLPAAFAACSNPADPNDPINQQRIIGLSATTNATAQRPDWFGYSVDLCYNEIFGVAFPDVPPDPPCPQDCPPGTRDGGAFNTLILRLSNTTNAHAQAIGVPAPVYPEDICYGDLACQYVGSPGSPQPCAGNEKCIVTLSGSTNAHLAICNIAGSYDTKLCCSSAFASAPAQPSCTVASAISPIALNGSSTVTVTYSNFSGSPALGAATICGDGASYSGLACAAGSCTFSCGPYSPAGNYNVTVQLLDGASPVNCAGTVSVAVNAAAPACGNGAVDIALGETCDIGVDGNPGTADDVDSACDGLCQAGCVCRECSIIFVTPNPVDLSLGNDATVSIAYSNFSNLPVQSALSCGAGSGVSPSPLACVLSIPGSGTCNFLCNDFSTVGTYSNVSATLADGAGGLNVTCIGAVPITVNAAAPAPCGNGVFDAGEECGDPGTPGCGVGKVCNTCLCVPVAPAPCGNGVIDIALGETCDIGVNLIPGDADDVDLACDGLCQASCNCLVAGNPLLQIVQFVAAPRSFAPESSIDEFVSLIVKVKNNGGAGRVTIRLDVLNPLTDGPLSPPVFDSATCPIVASGEDCLKTRAGPVNNFPLLSISNLPPGAYKLTASALDSANVVHDKESLFFTVLNPTPVPELDAALLPIIALSVLAVLFFSIKRKG